MRRACWCGVPTGAFFADVALELSGLGLLRRRVFIDTQACGRRSAARIQVKFGTRARDAAAARGEIMSAPVRPGRSIRVAERAAPSANAMFTTLTVVVRRGSRSE